MNVAFLFLAVGIGALIAYAARAAGIRNMPIYLAFSGAFLFSVTVLELLPELILREPSTGGIYIMAGVLMQIVLEFFSRGAEHGHVHHQARTQQFPWLLLISLSVHAFFEGFPVATHSKALIGVMVHKIPIATILTLFFLKAQFGTAKILAFLLIFATMTPFGYLLSSNFQQVQLYQSVFNGIAIGIFLHVSTTILYEIGKDHKFNLAKLLTILLGFTVAYFL